MFVKKLTIEQFGRIEYNNYSFEQPLIVFAGEETEEIFAALCVALCNRLLRFQTTRYCFTEKSKIYAEIDQDGKIYTAEAVYDESASDHCTVNVYHGERRLSDEERTAVFQTSLEEEECSYFINRHDYYRYIPFAELDFTKKLAEYRQGMQEERRQEFSARTDGVGSTHTFRRELKKFCNNFLPQPLRIAKRLSLTMDEDGRFCAEDIYTRNDLSETENTLLQYFSFIEVNRFWSEVQNAMGRTVKKPLFISALTDKIDCCIDPAPLLRQTSDLGREVFLFAGDKHIGARLTDIDEKQIICCGRL